MILFTSIFSVLFAVSLFLTVFFYKRKNTITFVYYLIIPLSFLVFLGLLFEKLPDSIDIIKSLILTSLSSQALFVFRSKLSEKISKPAVLGAYFLTFTFWNSLYFPVLYLVRIPSWFSVIFCIIALGIFFAFCISSKKQNLLVYAITLVSFTAASFLGFAALSDLFFGKKLYTLILLSGTVLMAVNLFLFAADASLILKKPGKFISTMIFALSQIIIASAAIVMIYF